MIKSFGRKITCFFFASFTPPTLLILLSLYSQFFFALPAEIRISGEHNEFYESTKFSYQKVSHKRIKIIQRALETATSAPHNAQSNFHFPHQRECPTVFSTLALFRYLPSYPVSRCCDRSHTKDSTRCCISVALAALCGCIEQMNTDGGTNTIVYVSRRRMY